MIVKQCYNCKGTDISDDEQLINKFVLLTKKIVSTDKLYEERCNNCGALLYAVITPLEKIGDVNE